MTNTEEKPALGVELVVNFHNNWMFDAGLLSEQKPEIQEAAEGWAELLIPYHTDEAVYGFTVYLAEIPYYQICFLEMLVLKAKAAELLETFREFMKPMEGDSEA